MYGVQLIISLLLFLQCPTTSANLLERIATNKQKSISSKSALRSHQQKATFDGEWYKHMGASISGTADTPFGSINASTLHILFGIFGGLMLVAVVTLSVLLVQRNTRLRLSSLASEREPLMNGEYEGVSSKSALPDELRPENLAKEQNNLDKSIRQQRKISKQLKQQAEARSSRSSGVGSGSGSGNGDQTSSSESEGKAGYSDRDAEQERQALLEAAQVLSETATTLEKEREKTRAAASAAQNFEQKNRALLLAAAGERKQNNLLQTQAQEMKINHENILKQQQIAVLATEEKHQAEMKQIKEIQERLIAEEQKHQTMAVATTGGEQQQLLMQQQQQVVDEIKLQKQQMEATMETERKEREKEKEKLVQEKEKAIKDAAISAIKERSAHEALNTLMKTAEDDRVRLKLQYESALEKQREAANAFATAAANAENKAAQKEQILKASHAAQLVEREKEALALLLIEKERIAKLQASDEEKIKLLRQAEEEKINLIQKAEQEKSRLQIITEEQKKSESSTIPLSEHRLLVADEAAKLKTEHAAQLVSQEKEAAAVLAIEKERISKLQTSDKEKRNLLKKAEKEKKQIIRNAEKIKVTLEKDAKDRMEKYVRQTETEKTRLQESHALLVKREQDAVTALSLETKRISKIQASDAEKAKLLLAAEEENVRLTNTLHEEKMAAEKEKAQLVQSFEAGLKSALDKETARFVEETADVRKEHASILAKETAKFRKIKAKHLVEIKKEKVALKKIEDEKNAALKTKEEEKNVAVKAAENEKIRIEKEYQTKLKQEKDSVNEAQAKTKEARKAAIVNAVALAKEKEKAAADKQLHVQEKSIVQKEAIALKTQLKHHAQEKHKVDVQYNQIQKEATTLKKKLEVQTNGRRQSLEQIKKLRQEHANEKAVYKQCLMDANNQQKEVTAKFTVELEEQRAQTRRQSVARKEAETAALSVTSAALSAKEDAEKQRVELLKIAEDEAKILKTKHAAVIKAKEDEANQVKLDHASALESERKKSESASETAALALESEARALSEAAKANTEKIAMKEKANQEQALRLQMEKSVVEERGKAALAIETSKQNILNSKSQARENAQQELDQVNTQQALAAEAERRLLEEEANVSAEKEVKKLKKRKPSFRGSLLTKTKVMDTIGAIFEKKARADTIRVSKLKPRVSLAQSARDFFVQMYGTIARDRRMAQFRHSVLKHKSANIRIRWFGTLIGWTDDRLQGLYTPFRGDAIHMFIDLLMEMFQLDLIEESLDQDPCLVNLNNLFRALGHLTKEEWADEWVPATGGIFDEAYRETESFKAMLALFRSKSIVLNEEESPQTTKKSPQTTKKSPKKKSNATPSPPKKSERYLEFQFVMDLTLREWYRWKVPQDQDESDKKSSSNTSSVTMSAPLMVL